MVDSNTAFDSMQNCDKSVQALMFAIRDRTLEIAAAGTPETVPFDFDVYYQFVEGWNEYKAGNEKRKGWYFNPATTLDSVKVYWDKNVYWRGKAEAELGLKPLTASEVPPADPPPKGDPSRGLPYENVLVLGLGVAGLYLVARLLGKA